MKGRKRREKAVLLFFSKISSLVLLLVQPKKLSQKKKNSPLLLFLFSSSLLRSFGPKNNFEIRAKREEIRFLSFFPPRSLSSRIARKSLPSSFFFFFVVSQKEEEEECLERLLRRAHDITTKKRERERERERERRFERTSPLQKREVVFLSPFKTGAKETREKRKRNVPMRTTRRWWPQRRPPWRAFPTSWTLGRPSC